MSLVANASTHLVVGIDDYLDILAVFLVIIDDHFDLVITITVAVAPCQRHVVVDADHID